jgi:hypothetical protein
LRKEKRRKKKREKGFEGKKHLFAFFVTMSFTPSFPPFQSTMPPLFFLHYHPLHTTVHTTPSHTPHNTTTSVFCPHSLCVTVSALNQTTQHHVIMQLQPPHMAQPMDDAMSEWERAALIVDTTPQTPSTTMK